MKNLVLGPSGLTLREGASEGRLETHPIEIPSGFDHATVSWNIHQPGDTVAVVRFRVRGQQFGWSDWLGPETENKKNPGLDRMWVWDVDQVTTRSPCSHFQIDLRMVSENREIHPPMVRGVYFTSRNSRVFELSCLNEIPEETPLIESVPHLCQHDGDEEKGERLCSPTSLAMVLRGYGIEASPQEMAELAYDPVHNLYGVWPRAIHAAFQKRALGWVEYVGNWKRAVQYLKRGIPLVCSIAFRKNELENPPYTSTKGHLLVLLGIDEEGRAVTHDPNLPSDKGAFLKWSPKDFSKAWFGHGGLAYVIAGKTD
ncbi:MAG: C39 family peptidase [Candidatus Omnitrophica bacterium]|nr:C39 family peptidase [Candidatus Omnitrophota bacterium]